MKMYQALAASIAAMKVCETTNNSEWLEKHRNRVYELMDSAPSGSGFDNGTRIIWDKCNRDKLVFHTSYHHMDENGSYDGWTEHTIIVEPSFLDGFTIEIKGDDRDDIDEYIGDTFQEWLNSEVPVVDWRTFEAGEKEGYEPPDFDNHEAAQEKE